VRYRNSYRNTLLWTVGAFFEKLLRDGDFSETTMIYTSDHGQNLHEDGSSGLYTHCGPEPVSDEGVVPLVVLEGGKSRLDWQHDLAHNHDRSSHFMIFPTLLKLMGYDRTAAEAQYGNSLDALSSDPGTFNVLFNARLRREPVWLPVERARISHAATSDGPNAVLPSSRFLATGK
jgi:lipid A ethanolaminephosphotransferase